MVKQNLRMKRLFTWVFFPGLEPLNWLVRNKQPVKIGAQVFIFTQENFLVIIFDKKSIFNNNFQCSRKVLICDKSFHFWQQKNLFLFEIAFSDKKFRFLTVSNNL